MQHKLNSQLQLNLQRCKEMGGTRSLMPVNPGCVQLASDWVAGEHWRTLNIHRLDSTLSLAAYGKLMH